MKGLWLFAKEWIIGKLGGIPMWFFTAEELQRFYNRKMNEAVEIRTKDLLFLRLKIRKHQKWR